MPSDELSAGIKAGPEAVVIERPVKVVADVLLAGERQFDWRTRPLGDCDRQRNSVELEAAAERTS